LQATGLQAGQLMVLAADPQAKDRVVCLWQPWCLNFLSHAARIVAFATLQKPMTELPTILVHTDGADDHHAQPPGTQELHHRCHVRTCWLTRWIWQIQTWRFCVVVFQGHETIFQPVTTS
jgi:hypothetical protein